MCIICVSGAGVRQPDESEIRTMFERNPHGAGYMYAKDNKVFIHKGFLIVEDLLAQIKRENFTADTPVVYHFRISTQANIPTMTHPFPLTKDIRKCENLDVSCACGIAHNGIIKLTSTGSKRYSDTALFVTQYMAHIIRSKADLADPSILKILELLAGSKLAILDREGEVTTVGKFINCQGLLFSNYSFLEEERWFR